MLVEGRLVPDLQTGGPRTWTAQDGTVRASFELRAFNFQFVGGRDSGGFATDEDAGGSPPEEEDEIPF